MSTLWGPGVHLAASQRHLRGTAHPSEQRVSEDSRAEKRGSGRGNGPREPVYRGVRPAPCLGFPILKKKLMIK